MPRRVKYENLEIVFLAVWNRQMDLDELQRDELFADDIKQLKGLITAGMPRR